MDQLIGFLGSQAPTLMYLFLGAGAALENLFPPIPADTFVLLGGFLAAAGRADPWAVFLVTWGANVGAALLVFRAGHRYGRPFFQQGLGRHVLNRNQLRRLGDFYARWGLPAIFFARFLPGLRAMVPIFAGVTHQGFWRVALPLTAASGLWYGGLVWLGTTAGRNLDRILAWLADTNRVLLILALLVAVLGGWGWLRTRRERREARGEEEERTPAGKERE